MIILKDINKCLIKAKFTMFFTYDVILSQKVNFGSYGVNKVDVCWYFYELSCWKVQHLIIIAEKIKYLSTLNIENYF